MLIGPPQHSDIPNFHHCLCNAMPDCTDAHAHLFQTNATIKLMIAEKITSDEVLIITFIF